MAMLYEYQHKFALVEPYYRHALRIREKRYGRNHPATAETMALLGIFYVARGNCPRGSALVAKAIPILEKDPFKRTRLVAEAREAKVLAEAWVEKNKKRRVR
jgi:hypothetical protein